MWIITDKGFISAVAFNPKKDIQTGTKLSRTALRKLGKDPILARARVKEDLEQLRPFYPKLKIFEMKSSDYQFRAYIPRKAFMEWASTKAGEIDYDSHFKEVVRDRAPDAEGRYSAMMSVWSAMEKLQPRPAYGGWHSGGVYPSSLCTARMIKEVKADGEKVYGEWCNYTRDHQGKHQFEIPKDRCYHDEHRKSDTPNEDGTDKWEGTFTGNAWYACKKYDPNAPEPEPVLFDVFEPKKCKAKHATYGPCTLDAGHASKYHKWERKPASTTSSGSRQCAHTMHKFTDGAWKGAFNTGSNIWYPCTSFGTFGGSLGAAKDEVDEEFSADLRQGNTPENDNLLALMRNLCRLPISECLVDPATPRPSWELWVYAEEFHGEHAQLREEEVAQLVVDCIEDPQLMAYRDEYLEALDEFGYEIPESDFPVGPSTPVAKDQDGESDPWTAQAEMEALADEVAAVSSMASEDSLGSGAANALDLDQIEGVLAEGEQKSNAADVPSSVGTEWPTVIGPTCDHIQSVPVAEGEQA